MRVKTKATVFAVLAALLYAINIPVAKRLLQDVGSMMMAAFLYLGAGAGLLLYECIRKAAGAEEQTGRLTRRELPYTIGIIC